MIVVGMQCFLDVYFPVRVDGCFFVWRLLNGGKTNVQLRLTRPSFVTVLALA